MRADCRTIGNVHADPQQKPVGSTAFFRCVAPVPAGFAASARHSTPVRRLLQSGGVEVSKLPPSLIAAAGHPTEPQVSAGMVSSQRLTHSHFDAAAANGVAQSGLSGDHHLSGAVVSEAAAVATGLPQAHM